MKKKEKKVKDKGSRHPGAVKGGLVVGTREDGGVEGEGGGKGGVEVGGGDGVGGGGGVDGRGKG